MYDTLHAAFDFFNDRLFGGVLEPCIIVAHRKRNAHGYFWKDQWVQGDNEDLRLSEIALNPQTMGRTPREVMSTLVHEMVHHWDAQFNEVPKSGHGKLWAAKMDEVGLTPTSTGKPGGARTGRKVTHMIVDGGPFDTAFAEFMALDSTDMGWWSPPQMAGAKKKDLSKVKHTCPCCGFNAWFKLGASAYCGSCEDDTGYPVMLEGEL
jgi:hypothetical protein